MANNNDKTIEVTKNGDIIKLCNTIKLTPQLKDVVVTLPLITGATIKFTETPLLGSTAGNVWTIGDFVNRPEETFEFCYEIEVIDITTITGVYTGLGVTSTTQDVIDDSFILSITKVCPELGEEDICETFEVEEIVYVNPIKLKPKNVKVFSEPVIGRPIEAKKIITKKEVIKDKCPSDIKLS